MVKCRTTLDKETIKALARYHFIQKNDVKKKRVLTSVFGILLLALSIINAYGYWIKYYGTESIFSILLRSSVLFLLSFIILFTGLKGSEKNLYRELKQYFKQTQTESIDYIISEAGLQMSINENVTLYEWASIERMQSDDKFYYFSSQNKHSIISKKDLAAEDLATIDNLMNTHVSVQA